MGSRLFGVVAGVLAWVAVGYGQTKPEAANAEITIQGSLICNGACIAAPKAEDHVMVLFAIDGTADIRAELGRIMKESYPDKGLDADAAEKVMAGFNDRLKYYLAADSPALRDSKNKGANHYCMAAAASAVTGAVFEKDGKKWITASKIGPAKLKYPEPMMAADRPFVMPREEPVVLKVGEKLELKCVPIPPGEFLMGTPVYAWPYFQEEYPHRVKLTKTFYMSEIPITQEMFAAVMGGDLDKVMEPQMPAVDPKFADVEKFCRLLSEKTGRKVRLASDAEWEYAARVGTSNPGFREKYAEQDSSGAEGRTTGLEVKLKKAKANAWGLYDMASAWWEITGDQGMYNVRKSEVDPRHPPAEPENGKCQRNGRGLLREGWSIITHEFITEKGYARQKFRIVVEAEAAK